MSTDTFDTMKSFHALKAAGVPDKQAEAQVAVMADAFAINRKELATKDDLRSSEQRLDAKIELMRTELKADNELLRTELKADIREVEQRLGAKSDLLKWMVGAVIFIGSGILVRLFFPAH